MAAPTTIVYDISDEYFSQVEHFFFILESLGFRLHKLKRISMDELQKGKLILVLAKAYEVYTDKEIKLIKRSISGGHKLLLLLDGESAPFFDSAQKLIADCGILVGTKTVKGSNGMDLIITTNLSKKHRVTQGVSSVSLYKPKVLHLLQKKTDSINVLVRGERNHIPAESILSVSTRYGNGSIAVVSSWSIINNELIVMHDNALFMLVLIYWLIGRQAPSGLLENLARFISAKSE